MLINFAGPCAWILVAEIWPLSVRSKGVSIAASSNWVRPSVIMKWTSAKSTHSIRWTISSVLSCLFYLSYSSRLLITTSHFHTGSRTSNAHNAKRPQVWNVCFLWCKWYDVVSRRELSSPKNYYPDFFVPWRCLHLALRAYLRLTDPSRVLTRL